MCFRHLAQLCMNLLVHDPVRIIKWKSHEVPYDLYPALLTEAIFQRELHTIDYLVATWPDPVLDLQSIIPKEDLVEPQILSIPVEGPDKMSILDCIMYGLLSRKPLCRLRTLNFTGFRLGLYILKICNEGVVEVCTSFLFAKQTPQTNVEINGE